MTRRRESTRRASRCRSPIRNADVLDAESLVLAALDEFFHVRFEKATEREREYMAAMADTGEGPYRTAQVAERPGRLHGLQVLPVHAPPLPAGRRHDVS